MIVHSYLRNYRKRECGEETRYEKEKIYQYFEKKYDTYDTSLISKEIPDEMIEDGKWLLKKSTLDLKLVEEFFEENNILAPTEYIEYILAAAHCFRRLDGKLDNFLFEDDVDIEIEVISQVTYVWT